MRDKIEVRIRKACHDCEGGTVPNADWLAFHEDEPLQRELRELEGQRRYDLAADLQDAWWSERGHDPGSPRPPEEEPCSECDGSGWLERWIDVTELAHIGYRRLEAL